MAKLRLVNATSLFLAVPVSVAISASVPVAAAVPVAIAAAAAAVAVASAVAVSVARFGGRRSSLAHAAAGRAAGAGMRDRGAVRRHLAGPARRLDQVAEGHGPLAGVGVLVG